jgi:hypothetical protein
MEIVSWEQIEKDFYSKSKYSGRFLDYLKDHYDAPKRKSIRTKEELLEYIYEYASEFGRYYHLDADMRDHFIKEKILTPEEFLNDISNTDTQKKA